MAAMEAYTEALLLLDQVLITVDRDEDKMRIQQIYDTYSERIRSLHLLSPKPDSNDLYHTFGDTPESKPVEPIDNQTPLDWLSRPANRKYSNRSYRGPQTPPHNRAASPIMQPTRPMQKKPIGSRSNHYSDDGMDSPTPTYSRSTPNTRSPVKPEDAFSPLPPPRRKPSLANRARSPSPMRQIQLQLIAQPSLPPPTAPLPKIPTSISEPTIPLEPDKAIENEDDTSLTPTLTTSNIRTRSLSSSSSLESLPDSSEPSSLQSTPVTEKENVTLSTDTTPSQEPIQEPKPTEKTESNVARILPPQRKVSLQHYSSMTYSASLPIPHKQPIVEDSKPLSPPNQNLSSSAVLLRSSSVHNFPSMFGRSTNSVLVRKGSIPIRSTSQSQRPSLLRDEKNGISASEYFGAELTAPPTSLMQKDQPDDNSLPPVSLPTSGSPLYLIKTLECSMTQGAYLSRKLFVPKKLWHQPNVRLPSLEAKLSAIETLIPQLARLELWAHMTDMQASMRQVDALANMLETLQNNLSKKLGQLKKGHESTDFQTSPSPLAMGRRGDRESMINGLKDPGAGAVGRKQLSMWGSRLSKTMSFSSGKSEDLYQHYIDALLKLFQASHVLDTWINHYNTTKKQSSAPDAQCEKMLQKLRKVCDSLDTVIGGFVVRDLAILLGKWMKRGSTWVGD
ncbi:hypothetical protein NQZ79_g8206 [Umbelopsis isabellina]|nr:hypothetical protein NQZ79_g8206 [Umbelopsis isabellina]